jgi:hypothetical protein
MLYKKIDSSLIKFALTFSKGYRHKSDLTRSCYYILIQGEK